MTEKLTESAIEALAIEQFEKLGYQYLYAPAIAPDSDTLERGRFEDVVLLERLRSAVARINPTIPADAREEAVKARAKKTLVQSKTLMEMLQNAIQRYHAKIITAVEVMC